MNKVFLGGNLTKDPELRYTPSGMGVTDIRLAINRIYLDRNNEKHEETTFVDIVVWGKQAETVCQYLKKGSAVLIEGALQFDSWEKEGQKHSKIRVKASRVQFLTIPGKQTSIPDETGHDEEHLANSAATPEDLPY